MEVLNFDKINLSIFKVVLVMFLELYLRNHCLTGHKDLCLWFLIILNFIWCQIGIKLLIKYYTWIVNHPSRIC